jgi:glycosyltransferase involved in cell wall biosynthesis
VEHLGSQAGADSMGVFYFDWKRKGLPFAVPGVRENACRWMPGRVVEQAWKRFSWPPYDWFAGAADVYHFPNFILPPMQRGRMVVSIHDVAFLKFPEMAEEKNLRYLRGRIQDTVRRADAILTLSDASANDIRHFFPDAAGRVYPVHLAAGPEFRPAPDAAVAAVRRRLGLERPYLLSVSTIEPRKNLPFMMDVFDRLEGFDGDLVIAGMPGWKCEPVFERMRTARRTARIRYVRYVDDASLPALYTGASAFLCTSHYEGFGLPPIEAMACGTPVVSSACGSLGEVLGQGACVLDGFELDAWVQAVDGILQDAGRRQALAAVGRAQAGRYSWAETARRTWGVYRKVAS